MDALQFFDLIFRDRVALFGVQNEAVDFEDVFSDESDVLHGGFALALGGLGHEFQSVPGLVRLFGRLQSGLLFFLDLVFDMGDVSFHVEL